MSPRDKSEEITSEDSVFHGDTGGRGTFRGRRQTAADRRGKRLKNCNIRMLFLSVAILIILCMLLAARVRTLNGTVAKLKAQMENLTRLTLQQRETIERLALEAQSAAKDDAVVGSLEKDPEGQSGQDSGEEEEEEEDEVAAAHKVYLTFDDGPSANTEKVLDILDRYGVKATFFVVGEACEENEEILKKIVEAGHTLGMHSWSHKYAELYESVESFGADLKRQRDFLYEVTGVKSKVYRFPGGSSNKVSQIGMQEFARYLDSQGIRFFDWNVSSGDGGSYLFPVETIYENCTSRLSQNAVSVVLMHDSAGKSTTLEALPAIIEQIQSMEDTVILPITGKTEPVQHIEWRE